MGQPRKETSMKRKDSKFRGDAAAGGDRKRKKGSKGAIPLPEDRPEDSSDDGSLSGDDAKLLQDHAALGFLANLPRRAMDRAVSEVRPPKQDKLDAKKAAQLKQQQQKQQQLRKRAASSDEEEGEEEKRGAMKVDDKSEDEEGEAWERGPRRVAAAKLASLSAAPLPVKSLSGDIIMRPDGAAPAPAAAALAAVAGIIVEDDLEKALREEAAAKERRRAEAAMAAKEAVRRAAATEAAAKEREQGVLGGLAAYDSLEQRREEAKRAMAVAAQAVLGNPEGQIGKQGRVLVALLKDEDSYVARLAMLSMLAVMKDLIPGYRILPAAEREQEGVAISKEVRQLWDFEAALLKTYQAYLKALLAALNASRGGKAPKAHGRVAAKCLGSLLATAPHFNYASDLLQAVVPNMASKDEAVRKVCCDAVGALLRSSLAGSLGAGQTGVEAVQLVADLVKRRKCVAPPEIVACLLGLSFPDIASGEDLVAAAASRKKKKKKDKKVKDEVEKGFKEAQAVVDRDTRRHQQSVTLEALFEIFFRVIKTASGSGLIANAAPGGPSLAPARFDKRFPLVEPALQGLRAFAHLISVDFFQDLLAALEELAGSAALPPAPRLRCLVTAAEILRGQGEALTVDRGTLYRHMYSALMRVALTAPTEEEILNEDDADNGEARNLDDVLNVELLQQSSASSALLAQLLERTLLDSKLLDAVRQGAFAKRVAALAAAAGDSGGAMGLMCVLQRMLRRTPKLRGMLENEEGGPTGYRTYRPDAADPADAGALAVPLWEVSLLERHFHPHVGQAAREIARMNATAAAAAAAGSGGGGGASSVLPLGVEPAELAMRYSTATGGFCPPPKAPTPAEKRQQAGSKASRQKDAAAKRKAQDSGALSSFVEAVRGPTDYAEDGEVEEGGAAAAAAEYYALNRRFKRNAELRREHAVLGAKLRRFHEHLQAAHAAADLAAKKNKSKKAAVDILTKTKREKKMKQRK